MNPIFIGAHIRRDIRSPAEAAATGGMQIRHFSQAVDGPTETW